MESTTYRITVNSTADKVAIYYLSDIHLGSGNYNESALKKSIKEIADNPNAYWIGMGDYGDFIFYTDHRFSPNSESESLGIRELRQGIMGQVRKIGKLMEPIAGKCIGLHTGNHEEKVANRYHTDPTKELCYLLNVPFLGYLALIRIWVKLPTTKCNDYSFVICSQHGTRAPRSLGGKLNVAQDGDHGIEADIYAVAHSHGMVSGITIVKGISTRGVIYERQRLYIVTSSYLENAKKGTISYAEKGGYPQSPMRSPYSETWLEGKDKELKMRPVL